jgi:TolB-like protein
MSAVPPLPDKPSIAVLPFENMSGDPEQELSETNTVSPLRHRMIEDMAARKLNPHTQRGHVYSCKGFAAWLKRSPDTATPDKVRRNPEESR